MTALATGAAVAAAPLFVHGRAHAGELVLAAAAVALLVPAVAGLRPLLGWALLVLGACAAAGYAYGDLGRVGLALCAGGLVLVGEAASTAGDLASVDRVETGVARDLAATLALSGAGGCAVAAVVLAAASLGPVGGAGAAAFGAAALVVLLALIVWLVLGRWRSRTG